ncbi:MAG: CotH kinase family protein [Flavobacteriales bacterium]|nr:CotH kinase family protein [Flavobacteriales bacterium]
MDLFLKDPLYELMEFDPGFSSVKNIIQAFSELPFSDKAAKAADVISQNTQGFPDRPPIERIDIDIKFLEQQKILDDRNRAISYDFLTNPITVKAKLRFKNRTYKARVRLKGDLGDHWYSKTRMSLRVSLKGKKTIFGFKKFSIQKPRARQHPYDQTFQSLIRNSENLSPVHEYAHIYVNGKYWGVMNIEEHISKELLEKQQKKDSIVIRLGTDKAFELSHIKKFYGIKGYKLSDPLLNIRIYGEKKSLRNRLRREWLTYLSTSLLENGTTNYLDINSFSRALIAASFWNNAHTLSPLNSRYYFNPYTLRLEPLTTDQGKFSYINDNKNIGQTFTIPLNNIPFYKKIMQTPFFKTNLLSNSEKTKTAFLDTQKELDYFQNFFPLDKKLSSNTVIKNIKTINKQIVEKTYTPIETIKTKNFIQKHIDKDIASQLPHHLHVKHYDSGKFEVYNLLPHPVTLNKILVSETNILEHKVAIPPYEKYNFKMVVMK